MGGLVGYESSDDEQEAQPLNQPQILESGNQGEDINPVQQTEDTQMSSGLLLDTTLPPSVPPTEPQPPQADTTSTSQLPQQLPQGPSQGPAVGPTLGPSMPDQNPAIAYPEQDPSQEDQASDDPPKSPYTTTRSLLHSLTLPSHPNTAIPPSPPGSPPPALTTKFDTFLTLKSNSRTPTHFNARLSASAAMRNPGLMDKLLDFVGIDDGAGQYATVLGKEGGWDAEVFPAWAYKGQLRRAADRAIKERERKVGGKVEFVSAGEEMEGRQGIVDGQSILPAPVTGKRKTRFD